jgi:hypothetical protein
VILATGPVNGSKADSVRRLIGVLNADSDLVLVALGEDAAQVAPAVWSLAAYVVQLPPEASEGEILRMALQEVLNHGRDAALVVSAGDEALSAGTVHKMVEAFCAAGDEIWAVLPDAVPEVPPNIAPESGIVLPALMGRRMMELALRGEHRLAAHQILSANAGHVLRLSAAATALPGAV